MTPHDDTPPDDRTDPAEGLLGVLMALSQALADGLGDLPPEVGEHVEEARRHLVAAAGHVSAAATLVLGRTGTRRGDPDVPAPDPREPPPKPRTGQTARGDRVRVPVAVR